MRNAREMRNSQTPAKEVVLSGDAVAYKLKRKAVSCTVPFSFRYRFGVMEIRGDKATNHANNSTHQLDCFLQLAEDNDPGIPL